MLTQRSQMAKKMSGLLPIQPGKIQKQPQLAGLKKFETWVSALGKEILAGVKKKPALLNGNISNNGAGLPKSSKIGDLKITFNSTNEPNDGAIDKFSKASKVTLQLKNGKATYIPEKKQMVVEFENDGEISDEAIESALAGFLKSFDTHLAKPEGTEKAVGHTVSKTTLETPSAKDVVSKTGISLKQQAKGSMSDSKHIVEVAPPAKSNVKAVVLKEQTQEAPVFKENEGTSALKSLLKEKLPPDSRTPKPNPTKMAVAAKASPIKTDLKEELISGKQQFVTGQPAAPVREHPAANIASGKSDKTKANSAPIATGNQPASILPAETKQKAEWRAKENITTVNFEVAKSEGKVQNDVSIAETFDSPNEKADAVKQRGVGIEQLRAALQTKGVEVDEIVVKISPVKEQMPLRTYRETSLLINDRSAAIAAQKYKPANQLPKGKPEGSLPQLSSFRLKLQEMDAAGKDFHFEFEPEDIKAGQKTMRQVKDMLAKEIGSQGGVKIELARANDGKVRVVAHKSPRSATDQKVGEITENIKETPKSESLGKSNASELRLPQKNEASQTIQPDESSANLRGLHSKGKVESEPPALKKSPTNTKAQPVDAPVNLKVLHSNREVENEPPALKKNPTSTMTQPGEAPANLKDLHSKGNIRNEAPALKKNAANVNSQSTDTDYNVEELKTEWNVESEIPTPKKNALNKSIQRPDNAMNLKDSEKMKSMDTGSESSGKFNDATGQGEGGSLKDGNAKQSFSKSNRLTQVHPDDQQPAAIHIAEASTGQTTAKTESSIVVQTSNLAETVEKIANLTSQMKSSSNKIEFQISVKNVGEVVVDALRHSDKVNLQIQVDSQEIRKLLEQHLKPMIEQLTRQGVDVGKLDVSVREERNPGESAQGDLFSGGGNKEEDAGSPRRKPTFNNNYQRPLPLGTSPATLAQTAPVTGDGLEVWA